LGVLPGDITSIATDINHLGKVIGISIGGSGGDAVLHAFLYSAGRMTPLNSIAGDIYTVAYSINKAGIAVGFGQASGLVQSHALIFVKDKVYDLNAFVSPDSMHLGQARAINDGGQIAGIGLPVGAPSVHAFLLTPVPHNSK
jgi:probable HAF family extracellular repeat protein